MHWSSWLAAAAIGGCAGGQVPAAHVTPRDIAGEWHACLTNLTATPTRSACGSIEIVKAPERSRGGQYVLRHSIAFELLLTETPLDLPGFGVANARPEEGWELMLGEEEGIVESADGGVVFAGVSESGDSLIG